MKNLFLIIFSAMLAHASASNVTDEIFLKFPNSGINFEGLYANPTDGTACVGDFDEDGKSDLIVMGPNYNEFTTSFVNFLRNNGDGTFVRTDLGLTGLNKGNIAYYKIAPKHYLLVMQGGTTIPASNESAIVCIAELKTENGMVSCEKKQEFPGFVEGQLALLDINTDGCPDIISYGSNRKFNVYENNGENIFSLISDVNGVEGLSYGNIKVLDVNKDGRLDILSVDQRVGIAVYLNSGRKSFTKLTVESDYRFRKKPALDVGDFNNDGYDDLVVFDSTNEGVHSVAFFYGNAQGCFKQVENNEFMGVEEAAVAVADFNGDGNLDVLYGGYNDKKLKSDEAGDRTLKAYVLLGDGTGNFEQHVKVTPKGKNSDLFTLSPVYGEYHVADFDGDGVSDVFVNGELGVGIGGKVSRRTELYLSSVTYGFGAPVEPAVKHKWEGFPYSQVRLAEGRLKEAQDKEIRYLKSLDVNKLFANVLEYNKIKTRDEVSPYNGWGGNNDYNSVFSHYLSAISMAYATTGDSELLERIEQSLEIIIAAQDYNGDGFYAFRDGTTHCFDYKLAKVKTLTPGGWDEYGKNGNSWDTNGAGIPLYAQHKLLSCLRDVYLYTGKEEARVAFLKNCEWTYKWLQNFDDKNFQNLLLSEHGGYLETMADAYALSGDKRYLDAAVKFTPMRMVDGPGNNVDNLQGLHSNFYCPIAVGAAVHYHYGGDKRAQRIAHNFFHIVYDHHTLCNGGNGNNERFLNPDMISYTTGMRGMESCSSYNMLKLAKELFMQEGDILYRDYFENTMYNHILATLSPREDAGVCYHTSLKPGTYKIYNDLSSYNFWCCVGTGMEAQVKYVDAIYFRNDKDLLINLFVPSTLNWEEKGLKATMKADFPNDSVMEFTIDENKSFSGNIVIPYPNWAENASIKVKINGNEQNVNSQPGEYIELTGTWKSGDKVQITIPCKLRLVDVPDDVNVSALFYGPILLAANLGDVGLPDVKASHHPEGVDLTDPVPDAYFPELKIKRDDLSANIKRTPGKLEFYTVGLDSNYVLKPFYDTHHCRYNVNWKFTHEADAQLEKALVVDYVIPGDEISESKHNLQAEDSGSGLGSFSFWGQTYFRYRNTAGQTKGAFSYDLELLPYELPEGEQYYLQVTYFGSEPVGYGNFFITIDDKRIVNQGDISCLAPLSFDQKYYAIPREQTDGKQKITVGFGSGRTSVYGLRLLTTDNLVESKKYFSNAELESLVVSEGVLSPFFEPARLNYEVNVPASVQEIELVAEPEISTAVVEGTGRKTLRTGKNRFVVKVIAQDGVTTKSYVLTINRATSASSTDNTLKTLTVSAGELQPQFSADVIDYTVSVDYFVTTIDIIGIPADENAIVCGNRESAVLNENGNKFEIKVLSESGEEKTYTVNVVRNAKSKDATLKSLTISKGNLSPQFSPTIYAYTVELPENTAVIEINAVPNHLAAKVSGAGRHGFLVKGENLIKLKVLAEDGESESLYELTVRVAGEKSSDASLRLLAVSSGELSPVFNADITDYTTDVLNSTNSLVIVAVPNSGKAMVTGAGEKMGLQTGANPFEIKVLAEDGVSEKTYHLVVNKEEENAIADLHNPNLSIYVTDGVLNVRFKGVAGIQITSLAGWKVERTTAENGYSRALDAGVYVLTINGESYKIVI